MKISMLALLGLTVMVAIWSTTEAGTGLFDRGCLGDCSMARYRCHRQCDDATWPPYYDFDCYDECVAKEKDCQVKCDEAGPTSSSP
ncbi:hypothetical protein LSAT2_007959 [Lamellibrachia satsuma]|nr:hypothetical protein LSAT2_007959 [Lamellibrachia satsuma]